MPLPIDTFRVLKTSSLGKSEVLTTCVAPGETSVFDPVAFLEEQRVRLVAALSTPPDLMTTTTAPPRWSPGDFRPSWSLSELRAFGLGWREIEDLAMSGPVKWELGERERLSGGAR